MFGDLLWAELAVDRAVGRAAVDVEVLASIHLRSALDFTRTPGTVHSRVIDEVRQKEERLRQEAKPDGIQKVLVTTTNDVAPSVLHFFDRHITLKDLLRKPWG